MVKHPDSVDKIIVTYLASISVEDFRYKSLLYRPVDLQVSPLIFRSYICPPLCGACCPRFSLDYLPWEILPYNMEERWVEVSGRSFPIYSDLQEGNTGHHCKNLDMRTGRCVIHDYRPFSCDFELLRFLIKSTPRIVTYLLTKQFGRAWNLLRCDKGRGALCQIEPWFPGVEEDIVRRLYRLKEWAGYFEVPNCLVDVIEYVKSGPHDKPLLIEKGV